MKNVVIRRCPTCEAIGDKTEQLLGELANDPDVRARVVDGEKGEFAIDMDGHSIDGEGSVADIAAQIRDAETADAS